MLYVIKTPDGRYRDCKGKVSETPYIYKYIAHAMEDDIYEGDEIVEYVTECDS